MLVSLRETLRFSFYQMSTWSSVRIMKSLRSGLGSIRSIFMTALVDLSFFLNRLQTSIRRRETIGVSIENNVVTETRRNYAMW